MIHFEDFPYAQVREALNTIAGRLALVFAAMVLGSLLAAFTATESWGDVISCIPPLTWFLALFSGYGFIVLPGIVVFAILFVRMQWPLPLVLLVTAVMWWDGHGAIRWGMYDSPAVKRRKGLLEPMGQVSSGSQAK
ncbi:hypothetical protein [Prosthecobacter sp.]|uniref:hypothetical protein n=1 Tax=Prosthecobacter sp. TaxID=1965333 RepID=UPI00378362B7